MTSSSKPFLGLDKTYQSARKDRVGDLLMDYLGDEELDSRHIYEEFLSEVDSLIKYHRAQYNKARQLQSWMLGYSSDVELLLE